MLLNIIIICVYNITRQEGFSLPATAKNTLISILLVSHGKLTNLLMTWGMKSAPCFPGFKQINSSGGYKVQTKR